ncbi:Gfo/Idh/MocA family protein [Paraburkholderia aspalathi]|nr:Gfo/Idh/MocA family oxidoreductase [Paraburkholderia aspalathi]
MEESKHQDGVESHPPRPIRWGIVGAGHIAGRFAEGLSFVQNVKLVGVWARRGVQAEEFARKHGTRAYASFDDLLDGVDALYIATLPDSHSHYATRAFSAGRAVLCEKPAAVSARELQHLLNAAKASNVLFMEAMKPPFYPLFLKLTEHLAEDPIGDIGFVRAGCSIADVPLDHPSFRLERGGGALLNIGIYEAFLAVRFLGSAINVQTLGKLGQTGVDSFASLNILHENGIAQIFCGLDLDGKGDAFIAGTKGSVTIHENWWNPSRATVRYLGGRAVELHEPFQGGGLNYETAHFCEVMRSGGIESPVVTHAMSMKMIAIMDAARAELGLIYPFEARLAGRPTH